MSGRVDGPLLAVAAGAFAVVCCAGLPVVGALIGGITIAAVLGVAGGVLAFAAALGAALLVRSRRRRGSAPPVAGGPLA